MTDNIKPDHYRTGEIDLYEAFSQIFPHNEYRAGMQMIAMRYMFRDKIDRVEDIGKAIYSLERLKEKEIEYREKQVKSKDEVIDDAVAFADHFRKEKTRKTLEEALGDMFEAFANMGGVFSNFDASETIHKQDDENIRLLNSFLDSGYNYLARDENSDLWIYKSKPKRNISFWNESSFKDNASKIDCHNFPEVKWLDEEPTKITDLLETYSREDTSTNLEIKVAGEYLNWTYLDHTDLLEQLLYDDYLYLARDRDGVLYASDGEPYKVEDLGFWDVKIIFNREPIQNDDFPEVKWSDDEPTEISELLEAYENGGENGK